MKRAVRRTLLGAGLAGVVTAVTVAATVAPSGGFLDSSLS